MHSIKNLESSNVFLNWKNSNTIEVIMKWNYKNIKKKKIKYFKIH